MIVAHQAGQGAILRLNLDELDTLRHALRSYTGDPTLPEAIVSVHGATVQLDGAQLSTLRAALHSFEDVQCNRATQLKDEGADSEYAWSVGAGQNAARLLEELGAEVGAD